MPPRPLRLALHARDARHRLSGCRVGGGAFAVVSNNLDPSAERSFASVYATVAHELFHLVQFSYFRRGRREPAIADLDPRRDGLRARDAGRTRGSTTSSRRSSCDAGSRRPGEHRLAELRRTAALAAASTLSSRGSCRRSSGASPRGRRRRGTPRRRGHLRADRGGAVRAGVPPLRRLRRRRPRRRDRARVPPRRGATAQRRRRAARRALRPAGAAARRRVLAHRHLPARRGSASATLTYELESEVAGGRPSLAADRGANARTTAGRRRSRSRRRLRADPRLTNPLLVVSNGGGRAVRYAVSAR